VTPLVITLIAILAAACGVWMTSVGALSRRLVPFGGGVLVGVAVFWVLPEMAEYLHWSGALAWIGAGFAILWIVDKYIYQVCPACSHSHTHEHCATRLHGFALPLLAAAALHSTFDGWSIAMSQGPAAIGSAFTWGIAVHKIPEGIALGVIARAALASRAAAIAWCGAAQGATLTGAALESVFASHLQVHTLHALLALAGGVFFYLGGHAVHGELQRSGPAPAFVPALTGVAGSTVLRFFVS